MLKITLKLKIVNHNYWLVCSKNPLFVRIVGYIKIQKNFLKNVDISLNTEELQKKWNTASKKEGNYYILNETPEQKNARYEAEHGAQAEDKTAPSQEDVKKAQTSAEKAKKAEEKSKAVKENKSGSKAEAKALPNTAAVK